MRGGLCSAQRVAPCAAARAERALSDNSQGQPAIPPEMFLGCSGEASGPPLGAHRT